MSTQLTWTPSVLRVAHHYLLSIYSFSFFFFNDTATTEIYTLSLHDALPIFVERLALGGMAELYLATAPGEHGFQKKVVIKRLLRSEEHTSELQSLTNLVCRLLLEKKKNKSVEYQTIN